MSIEYTSAADELAQWGLEHFYDLLDDIPEVDEFTPAMAAFIGLRAIKKASRRWDPDQLSFPDFCGFVMKADYQKFLKEGKTSTAAEQALELIDGIADGEGDLR